MRDEGFDRKLIAPLISGAVLNPINSTIIAVALVPIGMAFGEPPSATAWLISALYLATAVGQPVARNVPLLITYGRALLAYVVSYGFLYGFTQWVEDGRGLTAGHAGLVTLPMFGTAIVVSTLTGRREALRSKLIVAAVGQLLACALLLTLDPSTPLWVLIGVMAIVGIPQGLNSIALQNSVYRQADPDDIGASAGLLRTFTYLGAIASAAARRFLRRARRHERPARARGVPRRREYGVPAPQRPRPVAGS